MGEAFQSAMQLNLKNLNLLEFKPGTFQGLKNATSFQLDRCTVDEIPDGIFAGLDSLEWFSIKSNTYRMPGGERLPAELRNFTRCTRAWFGSGSNFDVEPGSLPPSLKWLRLYLVGNLPSGFLKGLDQLETLSFANSVGVPADLFADTPNLRYIQDIFHTHYGPVWPWDEGLAMHLGNVTEMTFHSVTAQSLPAGAFEGMVSLEMLVFSRWVDVTLPPGLFRGLVNLKTLSVRGEVVGDLVAGACEGLRSVTSFSISALLGRILPGAFQGMSSLLVLSLPGANEEFLNGTFDGLNLTSLHLRGTVAWIEPGTFEGQTFLDSISMDFQGACLASVPPLLESNPPAELCDFCHPETTERGCATMAVCRSRVDPSCQVRITVYPPFRIEGAEGCSGCEIITIDASQWPTQINDLGTVFMGEAFQSATQLNLKNLNLLEFKPGTFQGLKNATSFQLDRCTVDEIPDGIFAGLDSLEWFSIKSNTYRMPGGERLPAELRNFTRCTRAWFGSGSNFDVEPGSLPPSLKWLRLYLVGNLPSGFLKGLDQLETLSFANSVGVPADLFADTPNLRYIQDIFHTHYGPVWPWDEGLAMHLGNVTEMTFHTVTAQSLPAGAFEGMVSLEMLVFSRWVDVTLPPGLFRGLVNLKTLSVRGEVVGDLVAGACEGLRSVTSFSISSLLGRILPGAFHGLASLQSLDLSFAQGGLVLDVGFFDGLNSLEAISLDGYNIGIVPKGFFSGLRSLSVLSLKSCRIIGFEVGAMAGLNNLRTLFLDFNSIFGMPWETLVELPALTFLSLHGNPLTCRPPVLSQVTHVSMTEEVSKCLPASCDHDIVTALGLRPHVVELAMSSMETVMRVLRSDMLNSLDAEHTELGLYTEVSSDVRCWCSQQPFCFKLRQGATCSDGRMNGDENGVDCGGSKCAACKPRCNDGLLNGNETGIDCGGPCSACPNATCSDGVKNGDEAGVDCGGSGCSPCGTCVAGYYRADAGCLVCPAEAPMSLPGSTGIDQCTTRYYFGAREVGLAAVDLSAGNEGSHVCILFDDGSVRCMGHNTKGQLGHGQGDTDPRYPGVAEPVPALLDQPVQSLCAGRFHSCAVLFDGSVKCWGQNDVGQLGQGDTVDRGTHAHEMGAGLPAVDLGTNRSAVQVACGYLSTCAVLDDGSLKCWGYNQYGVLGQGDTNHRGDDSNEMGDNLDPVQLGEGRTVLDVSFGVVHVCALLDNAQVKCWGSAAYGKLGLGLGSNSEISGSDESSIGDQAGEMGDALPAVELGTGRIPVSVECGTYHTCVVLVDGDVKCWGENMYERFGDEQIGDDSDDMGDALLPVDLNGFVVSVAASDHSCAVLVDGSLKCWMGNQKGQLGQGDTDMRGGNGLPMGALLEPVQLGNNRKAVKVAAINGHISEGSACALLDDRTVKCWGLLWGPEPIGDEPGEMGDALPALHFGTAWYCIEGYAPDVGNETALCAACEPGKYKNTTGTDQCGECGPGSYSESPASTTCHAFDYCGDGVVNDDDEECDDGNSVPRDGCSACVIDVCGDGIVNNGGAEECDDGNALDEDACKSDCTNNTCGDGVPGGAGEQCDDGNANDADECKNDCTDNTCGDGVPGGAGEECDDGNEVEGDACNNVCQCSDGWTPSGDGNCEDVNECADKTADCDVRALCQNVEGGFTCSCPPGWLSLDQGRLCFQSGVEQCSNCTCSEAESGVCHGMAFCEGVGSIVGFPAGSDVVAADVSVPPNSEGRFLCMCPGDLLGHGYGASGCATKGYVMRVVYSNTSMLSEDEEANLLLLSNITCQRGALQQCDHVHYTPHGRDLGVNVLFRHTIEAKAVAEAAAKAFNAALAQTSRRNGHPPSQVNPAVGARVYIWNTESSSGFVPVPPSGMELQTVHFEANCSSSGCWVLDIVYTTGSSDVRLQTFNAFYLPYAVGSDQLSFDYSYSENDILDTFEPANFPCRVSDYVGADGGVTSLPVRATACCFGTAFNSSTSELGGDRNGRGVLGKYRATTSFASYAAEVYPRLCPGGYDAPSIDDNSGAATTPKPEDRFPDGVKAGAHHAQDFLRGQFVGMPLSPGVVETRARDPFIGQFEATIKLEERELRTQAGLLRGTVGVEHTVDFFLGFVNFKPATTSWVLDSLATQAAVHVEKTSFFSVSTHGVNDYTFFEYVNLRLVAVLNEDSDFSGSDEAADRTVRTNQTGAAHYLQVSFTLGAKYGVNSHEGLIPLESVRAGQGRFFDEVDAAGALHPKCSEYTTAPANEFASAAAISRFNRTLAQPCAPAAAMCSNPSSIPDSFVTFNIPLGVDFLGKPSSLLDNVVFVDLVISAVDDDARTGSGSQSEVTEPNVGEAPWQVKTTLTGSIPVVAGGVNIFCDGVTAKTDLKDVADVDIIVGTAGSMAELSRLRIVENAASTQLSTRDQIQVDSDSIEAGLVTLVLKGNASYFASGLQNNRQVSLELEDVITIHLMEDDGATADGGGSQGKQQHVKNLLAEAAQDNSDASGLDTDGYNLNGAFSFTIDRSAQRAHLEPSTRLLEHCPLNPPRPVDTGNVVLETCVTRRDVRYRDFPWRMGAMSTAMEVSHSAAQSTLPTSSVESRFFTTVLGDSSYARELASSFARVIDQTYQLDGRFRRAFWINPGYEWAPTQTGGGALFQLSQKIFLFALVSLDQNIATDAGSSIFDGAGSPPSEDSLADGAVSSNLPRVPGARRRVLLSVLDPQADTSLSSAELSFAISRSSLLSSALGVPLERTAKLQVAMELSEAEACLSREQLQPRLRHTLHDMLSRTATALQTVHLLGLSVHRGGVQCGDVAADRRVLLSVSSAAADMVAVVVFAEASTPSIDLHALSQLPGISRVSLLSAPPTVAVRPVSPGHITTTLPDSDVDSDNSRSTKTALVAGVGAGVGVLVVAFGSFVYLHMQRRRAEAGGSDTALAMELKAELEFQFDAFRAPSSAAGSLPTGITDVCI